MQFAAVAGIDAAGFGSGASGNAVEAGIADAARGSRSAQRCRGCRVGVRSGCTVDWSSGLGNLATNTAWTRIVETKGSCAERAHTDSGGSGQRCLGVGEAERAARGTKEIFRQREIASCQR